MRNNEDHALEKKPFSKDIRLEGENLCMIVSFSVSLINCGDELTISLIIW